MCLRGLLGHAKRETDYLYVTILAAPTFLGVKTLSAVSIPGWSVRLSERAGVVHPVPYAKYPTTDHS